MTKLELTARDVELIEHALHTQKKILSLQSAAGGTHSREKLRELKHLIRRVGQARDQPVDPPAETWATWLRSCMFAVRS